MSFEQRDFADFELGDDVLKLGGGVVQEMAAFAELELPKDDLAGALGRLVGVFGKDKVLRANDTPQDLEITRAADWVEESGVMKPLRRSLWTPELSLPDKTQFILTGAVANWQDRSADLLIKELRTNPRSEYNVEILAGQREMNSNTEVKNPYVKAYAEMNRGVFPSEYEYARDVVAAHLDEKGVDFEDSRVIEYFTTKGDDIAHMYMQGQSEAGSLFHETYTFVRVANAGIQLALQFRKAGRDVAGPGFDSSPDKPQVFVLTDTLSVARSAEQLKLPKNTSRLTQHSASWRSRPSFLRKKPRPVVCGKPI